MARIKIEDVIFWVAVSATIGVILWKLHGSPTDMATIIGIGTFILISEVAVWKKIFSVENNFNTKLLKMDKNISLSFMKLKNDMDNGFNNLENKLDKLIKRK